MVYPNSDPAWPFIRPPLSELKLSKKKVFAHWHVYRISIDNKDADVDYYTRNFLSPDGENGKYRAVGGLCRMRPLVRPVKPEKNWQVLDAIADMKLAANIGLDGFFFNIYII